MTPAEAQLASVRRDQGARLRRLLADILPANRFYAARLAGRDPADLAGLPFTTKADLAADQAEFPPYGTNLTFPIGRYTRLHQTSGTSTGRPLRWLDTPDSWDRLVGCWQTYLEWVGLVPGRDVLFFPFSFGPFLGFWTAFEAAARSGFLALPGGGMPTSARLRFLLDNRANAVFCTPTYALHLAEAAAAEGLDLAASAVRAVVVAGEPGAAVEGTRRRVEEAFGAVVYDQYGLTEVGPVACGRHFDPAALYVHDAEFVAEVIDPAGTAPVAAGEVGELVLTNLCRAGSPLIRYRTGDLVRQDPGPGPWEPHLHLGTRLVGGVLGRTDDMIHVRGNNVYPTAVEAVVRRFPEVAEFRLVVDETGPLADLVVEIEPSPGAPAGLAAAVAEAVRDDLLFRAEVTAVPPGSLPRFEMKARRVVRKR